MEYVELLALIQEKGIGLPIMVSAVSAFLARKAVWIELLGLKETCQSALSKQPIQLLTDERRRLIFLSWFSTGMFLYAYYT